MKISRRLLRLLLMGAITLMTTVILETAVKAELESGWVYEPQQPQQVCTAEAGLSGYAWDAVSPKVNDSTLITTLETPTTVTWVGSINSAGSDAGYWIVEIGDKLLLTPDRYLMGCPYDSQG